MRIAQSLDSVELSAKRTLLKQQTQLLGEKLPWLSDPRKIPDEALGDSGESGDLPYQCSKLAAWVLMEVVLAADSVQQQLSWEGTFEEYSVPSTLEPRILRAVLEPTSRYAPGIFAMSEIVAATPVVAARASVPRGGWGSIARKSENFGARISCDGSHLQVLIRNYLTKPAQTAVPVKQRVLDPSLLRLDEELGISTVTPVDDLVSAAKTAISEYIEPAKGVCVAILARAPACQHAPAGPANMYGAIWSAYTAAVDRLIFSTAEIDMAGIPAQCGPDPRFAEVIAALARQRAAALEDNYASKIWRDAQDEIKCLLARHARHSSLKPQ
jgi:hypothetical protein